MRASHFVLAALAICTIGFVVNAQPGANGPVQHEYGMLVNLFNETIMWVEPDGRKVTAKSLEELAGKLNPQSPVKQGDATLLKVLNALGLYGWEMCAFESQVVKGEHSGISTAYFKRVKK